MLGPRYLDPQIPRQCLVGGDLEPCLQLVLELLHMCEMLVEDDGIIDVIEDVGDGAVSLLPLIKTWVDSILLEPNGDHVVGEKREPRVRRSKQPVEVLHQTS